eukprot:m.906446 g.906446  ORF g.906446 m.906446 type:complete len:68 (-) comp23704_c0_seq18:795-998(-)
MMTIVKCNFHQVSVEVVVIGSHQRLASLLWIMKGDASEKQRPQMMRNWKKSDEDFSLKRQQIHSQLW